MNSLENQNNYELIHIGKPDPDEYPITISKSWMHINEMISINKYNENFKKNIETLFKSQYLIGWKRSKGDGNCYFRSVISTYFLSILSPVSPLSAIQTLKSQVDSLDTSQLDYEFSVSKSSLLQQINNLISLKSSNPISAFKHALELTQSPEFDLDLIRFARLITLQELLKSKDDPEYSFMFIDGVDFFISDVLQMNKEGGDHSLLFLPKALGIQVIQYMFLEYPKMSIQKFPENVQFGSTVIHIVRRECHYDILARIQEIENNQYNLNEGSYYFTNVYC